MTPTTHERIDLFFRGLGYVGILLGVVGIILLLLKIIGIA